MAIGLVAAGSSLGGVIFPIMVIKLLPQVGFGWTLRICAFLILALLAFGIATVRSRLTPTPSAMRLQIIASALALSGSAAAFSDSWPLVMFSTSQYDARPVF